MNTNHPQQPTDCSNFQRGPRSTFSASRSRPFSSHGIGLAFGLRARQKGAQVASFSSRNRLCVSPEKQRQERLRDHVSRRAFRARRREPRQSVDRVDRCTAEPGHPLRTRLSASDPIARETAQTRIAVASKAWHSAGRIHELANGPRKNRIGSLRLAAGCRKGPGNVSTKVQRLATQRATKRSSFGSLRLRHIC
jgi:hypothetical protein